MVGESDLRPGETIKHNASGDTYLILNNTLKMREPGEQGKWHPAIEYRDVETGEKFVRAAHDFRNFTLLERERLPEPVFHSTLQMDLVELYRRLLNGTFYQDYDEDIRLLGVLRPFAETNSPTLAELDTVIGDYELYYRSSADAADRAEYTNVLRILRAYRESFVESRTEKAQPPNVTDLTALLEQVVAVYDSLGQTRVTTVEDERALFARILAALSDYREVLHGERAMIAAYEASPEFQLEQPHATEDERAACDKLTRAAQAGKLALTICTDQKGERLPVFVAVRHSHDETLYEPLACMLPMRPDTLRLGHDLAESYITADNRSGG